MIGQVILILISCVIVFQICCEVAAVVHNLNKNEKKWRRMVWTATIEK